MSARFTQPAVQRVIRNLAQHRRLFNAAPRCQYRAVPTLLALGKSIALVAPLAWAAREFARRATDGETLAVRVAALLVMFYTLAVIGAGLLGVAGLLGYLPLLAFSCTAMVVARALRRFSPPLNDPAQCENAVRPTSSIGDAMLLALACAAVVGAVFAALPHPAFEYDALTYHLHFPAQWLNAGRIFLIETPFGDAAPEYVPANGSLWFAWLLAPWRDGPWPAARFAFAGVDALAKFGQLPFAALLAASIASLAETLTERKGAAVRPAALALLVSWVVWQSATPGVDLIFGACVVSSLAFGARWALAGSRGSAVLCGVSLGLALGTKFVGLVYLPVVLGALVAWNGLRRPRAADVAGFVIAAFALGAPWYLRNWIVAGNPLFPAHVSFAGIEVFSGVYARDAMTASVFRVPTPGAALVVAAHTFGYPLFFAALACSIRGFLAARTSRAWLVAALIAPIAFVWHFLAVPYSSQDRFLIWAAALAFVPAAIPASSVRSRMWTAVVISAVLAQSFGPEVATILWDTPVVFVGHFRVESILPLTAAWAFFVAAIFSAPYARMPKRSSIAARLAAFAAGVVFIAIAGSAVRVPMSSLRELPLDAYARIWAERPGALAYAGRNRPFHLAGRDGRTRVEWVPVDGRYDRAFHDVIHEQALGGTLDRARDKSPWRYATPDQEAWLAAFLRSEAEWLFVETLGLEERRYLGYDEQGFPVERAWALARPDVFEPVLAAPTYELYRVRSAPRMTHE